MDQDTDFKVEIIFSASAVDLLADRYGCGHKTIGKGSVADPELKRLGSLCSRQVESGFILNIQVFFLYLWTNIIVK